MCVCVCLCMCLCVCVSLSLSLSLSVSVRACVRACVEDGSVDYQEFEQFVQKKDLCRVNTDEVEGMRDAFQVFDKDGNGFIDVKEFSSVMTTIGMSFSLFVP